MTVMDELVLAASDLADPMVLATRVEDRDRHRNKRTRRVFTVTLPCLLDQLHQQALDPDTGQDRDELTRSVFRSTPPGSLDALAQHTAIEDGAVGWALRIHAPIRYSLPDQIRALVGAASHLPIDQQRPLVQDMRRWRIWAATVLGYLRPPDRPRAPCPLCSKPDSLRVRLDSATACCLACGGVWDSRNISILAEHCRAYAMGKVHSVTAETNLEESKVNTAA